jgi:hypothetical protein
MNAYSVSLIRLARRVVALLGARPGEDVDVVLTREGSVLLKRCES